LNTLLTLLPDFIARDPLPYAFLFLLVFGFTTPICEEIAVALVGMTIKATGASFAFALAIALIALFIQDTLFFFVARLFGARIIRHKLFSRLVNPKAIEDGERYFLRRGPFIVFSSRFVVGLRSAVIMGAGLLRMRWSRFVLYDSLAAAIMTPSWLFVGFGLGAQLDGKVGRLAKLFGILGPAAILAAAFLVYRGIKADKAKADAEPSSQPG
jgi:membrane protein DedA with SNARE-associated domain